MKLTLIDNNPLTLKRARSLYRRREPRHRLTLRNGNLYTMRYNPGIQPRTESQEKSWSLFKEANARVAADFAVPSRKAHWVRLQRKQSRYKTARGLARAYYMSLLKSQLANEIQDIKSSNLSAASSLRLHPSLAITPASPSHPSSATLAPLSPGRLPSISWTHHRNVHWWQSSLKRLRI
ncbi:MAG: hypothetical protein MJZ13_00530 [Bacteroidales bacterium]|nr:hypothetical protein [Bacteroidales bacterium]